MNSPGKIPDARIRLLNDRPARPGREFVLYWMVAARRARSNFALQRAVELAQSCGRPLLVLEALLCGYPFASDRLHRFVLQGMAVNAAEFAARGITYHGYVEPEPGAGSGLLHALGRRACAVVTDDYPCFVVPRILTAGAARLDVRCEAVDGNGLLPMRAADRAHVRAHLFRRLLHKALPRHVRDLPQQDPCGGAGLPAGEFPGAVLRRWPAASPELLADAGLAALPIDHAVAPVVDREGGSTAAHARLRTFLATGLPHYAERRNQPEQDVASGLSPWLHFGHLGAHEVFAAVAAQQRWTVAKLAGEVTGAALGWWGMDANAEAFLDQLVTWRELGFNMCAFRPKDYSRYESLPDWAQRTLAEHAGDAREHVYTPAEFAAAQTHDPLWNAAQVQLRREGRIHNTLRMLWGKKILEWSKTPQQALATMIELNDRFALDGRDPNSYSGIFWVLGRYDRPWAPQRPVFGMIRYMSSANTARKVRVRAYINRYR